MQHSMKGMFYVNGNVGFHSVVFMPTVLPELYMNPVQVMVKLSVDLWLRGTVCR